MLWFKDKDNIDFEHFDNNELVEYRLCRVLFGVTSSPFLLTATVIYHMHKYIDLDSVFVNQFLNSLHVDDLNSGGKNDMEAFEFYCKSKEQLKEASFNLRKFNSNSKNLEEMVKEKFGDSDCLSNETMKVLGLIWNKSTVKLIYDINDIRNKFVDNPTKREALHAIVSISDPRGLINPVVVKFKVFFQKFCVANIEWDEKIPDENLTEWTELSNEFKQIDCIEFDRNYCLDNSDDPFTKIELHGFSDASQKTYGCCIYLRFIKQSGEVKILLMTAKSRVSPLKTLTIPKLELLGCLMLSRILNEIEKDLSSVLKIDEMFAWTDSSVFYAWILNDNQKLPVFRGGSRLFLSLGKNSLSLVTPRGDTMVGTERENFDL